MRILFIAHDSFRAGAQLLTMTFIEWVQANTEHEIVIILKKDGELKSEISKLAPTYIWRLDNSFISKISRKVYRSGILRKIRSFNPDIIYSSTITNGSILHALDFLNKPVVTHVHEMDYWINQFGEQNLQHNIEHTTKFILPAQAVKENLCSKHVAAPNKCVVIPEFINLKTGLDKSLHERLGVSGKAILIAASGGEIWRKGKDLLVPIVINFFSKYSGLDDIHFVWIGGEMTHELNHDLENSGYIDRIHFIEHLPNAQQYFGSLYLFLMLSREDPFPLVNIEAASRGVPVICFDRSGGTPEFINDRAGAVVPYLDIAAMADKILELLADRGKRDELGVNAKKESGKYHVDVIAGKILKEMDNLVRPLDV